VSLMEETDYRSSNLKHYRDFIDIKNSAFGHLELGKYLSGRSELLAGNSEEFDGEEIHFLSIFSHGYENNIFGDSSDTIEKSEIASIFSSKSISFSKSAVIFLGACNAGTGKNLSFAQKLADITGAKVIGMVDDGVAVVSETTGASSSPKMIYGPKYGDKYNGKFYEFKKGFTPVLKGKEFDIIQLVGVSGP